MMMEQAIVSSGFQFQPVSFIKRFAKLLLAMVLDALRRSYDLRPLGSILRYLLCQQEPDLQLVFWMLVQPS